MGTLILAAAAASTAKSTTGDSSLLLILLVFAVLIVFMFRSQSRRKKQVQQTQNQVMDGSRIRTTFGVYGTVVESDDRNVMVEVAPGVKIKMIRQAIMAVVPEDEPDGVFRTVPDRDGDGTAQPDDRGDTTY
jgi:preprotein translocase subunit YajC